MISFSSGCAVSHRPPSHPNPQRAMAIKAPTIDPFAEGPATTMTNSGPTKANAVTTTLLRMDWTNSPQLKPSSERSRHRDTAPLKAVVPSNPNATACRP